MRTIKTLLATIAVLLCSLTANAHDFEVGGIYYNITSRNAYDFTVQVTYRGDFSNSYSNEYSGAVTIPSTVTYNDQTYSVTSIKQYTFYNCSSLTSIAIPECVTSIGDHAFYGCSSLTFVNIPEGVALIDSYTFYGCKTLKCITIPENVVSIGYRAFEGCSNLASIVIPENSKMTSIASMAFDGCSSLAAIYIPEGVTLIDYYTFMGCSSLKSITFPDGLTSVGSGAFRGCSSLETIIISEGSKLTSIGELAFYDCSSLKTIVIPDGVTSIGNSAFEKCSRLSSVTISDKSQLTSIENSAFSGCNNLESITIPCGVTSIGESAFADCNSLISITIPDGVTSINGSVFSRCSNLKSIAIPENVTMILGHAFFGCSSLTTITISEDSKLTSIGSNAFQDCSSLESITIPKGVTSIGNHAFYRCSNLTSVTVPENSELVSIGSSAFSDCVSLASSIIIPDGVTSIGWGAFYGCRSLTSIMISECSRLISIEGSTFRECNSLKSITIPEGVTSIGKEAFMGCDSLVSINMPIGVKEIGSYAFHHCSSLASPIVIPEGVTSIGDYTFYNCKKLPSIEIPKSITNIGKSAFYGCSTLVSIAIPDGVTSIGSSAFGECSNISSINIPENINTIESSVFSSCRIISIIIPESVTEIEGNAFRYCSELTDVYCLAENVPSTENDAFSYSNIGSATLHVPESSLEAYKSADVWKEFGNIVAITDENPSSSIDSGTYASGDSELSWEFTSEGELKINGVGSIPDIDASPWAKYQNDIKKVIIGEGVKSLGFYAFQNCSNMTSIVIPEGVTSISGISPFAGCSSLTDITLPSTLTDVKINTFIDSKWYQEHPDGLLYLSNWLMGYKGTMPANTTVEVVDGTVGIASFAFYNQTNLVGITIPDGVKSIGYCAFANTSITSISIPSSIEYLGVGAFNDCENLSDVSIPNVNNLRTVEARVFEGTAWMNGKSDGLVYWGNWLLCYKGAMASNEAITVLVGTVGVADEAFDNGYNGNLASIEFPNSLKYIGDYSFEGCRGLTSIIIPEGVTNIGAYAFQNCSNLAKVVIPTTLKEIGGNAFYGCNIKECHINSLEAWCKIDFNSRESVPITYPEGGLYMNETLVEHVTIPSSITKIKNFTFANNYKLTSIIIPEGVTSIGANAFWRDYNLREINLPNSITELRDYALACTGVTSITIGKNLTKMGHNPLVANPLLASIVVEDGNGVYDSRNNCNALIHTESNVLIAGCKNTIIPDDVIAIGENAFGGCSGMTTITIPGTVKTIGASAFASCSALESVELENGIESIEYQAFADCQNLTSITLPESVQEIGKYAFSYVMQTMTSKAQVPPTLAGSIFDLSNSATLYVPYNVLDDYKNAQYWSEFANIEPISSEVQIIDSQDEYNLQETMPFQKLTYTRTFNNTNWQALYVPFEIPVTEAFLADFEVADLNDVRQYDRDDDGVKDETVIEAFKVTSGTLEANYPYLIRAREAGKKTITVTDATLYATEENSIDCSSVREKFTFTGTYSQLSSEVLPQGDGYYALSGGVWRPVAEGTSLGAFRFYLKVDSRIALNAGQGNAIRMRIIGEEDDATGIDNPEFENQNSELIFDLQGRRIENPAKGVYIVNGVKRVF